LDAVLLLTAACAAKIGSGTQHRAGGADGRSAAIAASMAWNSARGTATSAIWNVIDRPCRTILAPIFTRRSRRVVSD